MGHNWYSYKAKAWTIRGFNPGRGKGFFASAKSPAYLMGTESSCSLGKAARPRD